MANLHVQPKRKSYAWLWILILILIIAGAVYYFAFYKKQEPAPTNTLHTPSSLQLKVAQAPRMNRDVKRFHFKIF